MGNNKTQEPPGGGEFQPAYKAYLNRHMRAWGVDSNAKVQPWTYGQWIANGRPDTGGIPNPNYKNR